MSVRYAFIQKDTNVRRPYNAAQLNVDSDNYGISSFYHSNDRAIGLTGDGKLNYTGSGWGHSTSEVFSVFLQEEGLLEPLKKTVLGKCEAIADAENKERLENGEPYIYVGGKIKDIFKSSIRQIKFTYEGKEYTVSVDNADSPFLKVNSVNEMFNVKEISEGKPYTFDGQQRIPDYLKGAIREINFSEDYNFSGKRCFQSVEEDELGIPSMAFANCSALERVNLPATITVFGIKCFYNVPEDCIIVTPRFPDRRIRCMPSERADIVKRIRFEDNTRAFKDEDSKSEEEK